MFIHVPGLEGGEQHGRGHTSENTTDEKPPEIWWELSEAAEGVDDGEGDGHLPPAPDVRQRPGARPKDDAWGEARHVEDGDLRLLEAIEGVQLVHVRTLQPVAQQGQEVNKEETLLKTKHLR